MTRAVNFVTSGLVWVGAHRFTLIEGTVCFRSIDSA